ncbi:MAG TPA: hypothetical protein VJV23_00660 [Candidatus Polarisedimenticolia bacterium]|nr:hypothetical protein [Candidatus Polarisedimenticolia bacterium]
MLTRFMLVIAGLLAFPLGAAAETWKDVPVIDTLCVAKVKAEPDKHTRQCALQCAKGGYGLLTPEGAYLTFDAAGNEKTLAALKATKKADHLRATVTGERNGESITVTSISIE